jgi:hypothetical protein
VIPRVTDGWKPAGLIAYLMGPGRAEKHRRPRIIATWDGRDAAWQPAKTGPGEWDFDLGPVSRAVRAPAVVAGLPNGDDGSGRKGYVWHLSARNAPGDRTLTDGQWAEIARDLLDGAGVARRNDAGGPRWVAIRHADDHVHVAVVLVRQDTGRRFWPHQDWPGLRRTARELEVRLQLTRTAPADRTAAKAPGRGELGKARRQVREPARTELARAVRLAAASSIDVDAFAWVLRKAGYLVALRYAPSGDVIGYKVARPGDLNSTGNPIFYSGSKLAPDLSMPNLRRRWEGLPATVGRSDTAAAKRHVRRARRTVAAARARGEPIDVAASDIASATGDLLLAADASHAFPGALAADAFDRASRTPRSHPAARSRAGSGLRHVARQMIRQRYFSDGSDDGASTIALAVALVDLVREIAGWHRDHGRTHQAAAAEIAAVAIDRWPQLDGADLALAETGTAALSAVVAAAANRQDEAGPPQVDAAGAAATVRPRIDRSRSGASRVPRD